jgi:TolA-binding protein
MEGRLHQALPRVLTALVAVTLAALALAACGGDDDDSASFQEDYPALSDRLVSLGEEVGQAIQNANTESDAALAEQFGEYAEQLDGLRQDLEELEPPEDLADEREDLVTAMGDVRSSLEGIASAAEDGDPQAARDATLELVEGSTELRDAREALSRAVREGE